MQKVRKMVKNTNAFLRIFLSNLGPSRQPVREKLPPPPIPPLGLFRFAAVVLGRDLDRNGFRERTCHCVIAWIMA